MAEPSLTNLKLYYYDCSVWGRGEFIHLLIQDSGLPTEYVRRPRPEILALLAEWAKGDQPAITVPAIELEDGTRLGGTEAILQFLARKLGYSVDSEVESVFIAMVGNLAHDWFFAFTQAKFNPETVEKYKGVIHKHQSRFERFYSLRNGPYLAGDKITYADFLVYHTLRITGAESGEATPYLTAFLKAFEARPRIKAYLDSFDHKAEYEKIYAFLKA